MNRLKLFFLSCTALALAGCASVVGNGTPSEPGSFSLAVTPASTSIQGDNTQQFAAKTSDGSNPSLTWSVNNVAGGSAATGTISASGLFTAPEFPPSPNSITVTAAETKDSNKSVLALSRFSIRYHNSLPSHQWRSR